MMALEEKLREHQSYYSSSWGDHECIYQISRQSIQALLRYFTENLKRERHSGTRGKIKASPKL